MVPLLQFFLFLPLIQPITNHVHGNSLSPPTVPSKSVSYSLKSRTDAAVKKNYHGFAGNAALEMFRPFLGIGNTKHIFYGKNVIKQSGSPNERVERIKTGDTLSRKTESRVQLLVSPKNRVKRQPIHTDMLPKDAANNTEPKSHSTEWPIANHSADFSLFQGSESTKDNPETEFKETDWSTVGSGDMLIAAEIGFIGSSTDAVRSTGKENAQYGPQVQNAYSVLASVVTAHTDPTVNPSRHTRPLVPAPANEKNASRSDFQATSNRTNHWDANGTQLEIGRFGIATPTATQPESQFTTLRSYSKTTTASTSTVNLQLKTPLPEVDTIIYNNSQPVSTAQSTSTTIPIDQSTGTGTTGTVTSTTNKTRETTTLTAKLSGKTDQQNIKGKNTFLRTTSSRPIGRGRFIFSENNAKYTEMDPSISQRVVLPVKSSTVSPTPALPKAHCATGADPCVFSKDLNDPNKSGATNGSVLVWGDLRRTLSFAWELHVFGSAALFLLLTAGAVLGLALAPSMHCPHRGELVLANSLLLVVGTVRAGHFLLDPYGTRLILPPPVIIALYTLPLPLFILAQAALVILALKEAGATLLPPALQSPPLLGVLAVLQCTLLLAADLLSPALSPAVPVILQSLTLTAGLALCLGYLFLALPHLSQTHAPQAGNKGMGEGRVRVLARVLAVCALLGVVCCLLHIYACLWLYGLLGDWRRFCWAWWLCQFWARLLELAWAFCLLLVSSWVFWRPSGGQICGAPRQEEAASENQPSSSHPSNSTGRHTCWAKIVQSLKVRQQKKSESNGTGGSSSGGAVRELSNNWAGQEQSGADISNSMIRNHDLLKDSNLKSFAGGSVELRLQALVLPPQRSVSSSLDRDKESTSSLYDFDLRPPTPIDLSRSIDEALHLEHLLRGGSLFQPLRPLSPPSPELWMRRNSEPQITLSLSSDEHTLLTESYVGLDRSIPSAVPSRQVTAPPTPTHQGFRWVSEAPVPSSLSCPVSLHPSPSTGHALVPSAENTRPFLTPDLDSSQLNSRSGCSYLNVSHQDDLASISSDIIDL
ncbi:proline-rich transmembrane protein 4 [Myxocyprinus asiaticus]|uniref:proline-rich transmembrane protein 4 n=1 Tax=Myxocyprinus asiaticus TaxID=70543 RepID=UPI0022230E0A|nr:proline-rich transmembrane protein 4 [Myxocyprinus asiaticus]